MPSRILQPMSAESENRGTIAEHERDVTVAVVPSDEPLSASWSDDLQRLAGALHRSAAGQSGATFFCSRVPRAWEPNVNVYETAEAFHLCLELAGMSTSEIDVTLDGETLVVSGTRGKPSMPGKEQAGSQRVSVPVMEIDSGPFERRIRLSRGIEKTGIEATYKNGFLWIKLPKRGDTGEAAQ